MGADYDIKVMVWEKNSMKPVCEAIEQSVNTAEKITEYKYLFTDDKVVKTSGSASSVMYMNGQLHLHRSISILITLISMPLSQLQ